MSEISPVLVIYFLLILIHDNAFIGILFQSELHGISLCFIKTRCVTVKTIKKIFTLFCRALLPSVMYLRLDGSVPVANRHSIVNR